MINFFKRLFAAIFGKKRSITIPEYPVKKEPIFKSEPQDKKPVGPEPKFFPFTGRKKWQMRNNRLHIRLFGETESMKCNKINRAQAIISRIRKRSVEYAVFTDKDGNQYRLV